MKVAIIGAGAAGLATAHELLQAGHEVSVFEQSNRIGGIWAYSEEVEDDLLGRNPRQRIHSSLYEAMRVNLPRELMALEGFAFDDSLGAAVALRYPRHDAVLAYLERFADASGVRPHIHFGHRVAEVTCTNGSPPLENATVRPSHEEWLVDGARFDAVAVCNGHYSEPHVPVLPGLETFPGLALHSHNYRKPELFAGKRVVVLGSSVSGADLSREIANVAADVFFCGRLFLDMPLLRSQTTPIKRAPPVERFDGDAVVLTDGQRIEGVDAFLFCTGYRYRFPFLKPPLATVDDNWVRSLYRQLILCTNPRLAFIGLPFRIVPFPLFQRQARWFARILNGAFPLPTLAERRAERAKEIRALRAAGKPQRHYHFLGDRQVDYLNDLAKQCGDAPVTEDFVRLWQGHNRHARRYPDDYRDRPLPMK